MEVSEALEKLLQSFESYYNVRREEVESPFVAEAEFHTHGEQYFLMRSAKLSEQESHEYVFFAVVDNLDPETLKMLDQTAWERGLSRVQPKNGHRNSDVTLFILAEEIEKESLSAVRSLSHYKSYRLGLQGWSSYRLVALEPSSGLMAYNRQGQSLKKLIRNIL